jgi:uncharacterized delta-60 repeat protein
MISRQRHFTIPSLGSIQTFLNIAAGRRAVALLFAVGCLFVQVAFAQAPGSNDPSFTSPFGPGGGNILAIVPTPDGKVFVGTNGFPTINGQRSGFFRLNGDGTRDTSFPFVFVNNPVNAIAVQPDGRILLGGNFATVDGTPRTRLARLNADGTLDAGFTPTADVAVVAIHVQPDGRILIGGAFTNINGTPRNRLARLNADGTLDSGFAPDLNGLVTTIRRNQAGKIFVGGEFTTVNGVTRNLFARLNADGTLDTAFPSLPTSSTLNPRIFTFSLTNDGRIVIGGTFRFGGFKDIVRLLPDGNFDPLFVPSFETGDTSSGAGRVQALVIQPDGKIVIGGSNGLTLSAVLSRLTPEGVPEPAFTPAGFTGITPNVATLALQANGRILVGGNFTQVNDASQPFIARVFAGCLFNPVVLAAPAGGMTGQLAVSSTDTACPFSATADAPWLSITSGSPGLGAGRIGFAVAPNTGGERTGTITVNGQIFPITQDAVAPTNVNALVTVSLLSSATAQPGTCNGVGYADDVILTAKLTNNSTVPLTDLSFVVTSLGFPDPSSSTGAIPGTPPFRLGTANDFVTPCVSGGLAGSPQRVNGGLAPGQSTTVTFRVARPEAKRFRFLMNVMGIAAGAAQKDGKTLQTASRAHEVEVELNAKR